MNSTLVLFVFFSIYFIMINKKQQQYVAPDPLLKILLRFILSILSYPYTIIRKYNDYNIRVGEMVNELKDEELNNIRLNNGKLVLIFIYLPITIGILFSAFSINFHKKDYITYWNNIKKEEKSSGINSVINSKIKKAKLIINEFPVKKSDILFLVYGYVAALIGARFLSLHPSFKQEKKLSEIFASLGYTDAEGNPWKITWTPDAVQIISFNCDPIQLCSNTRFWSTINFPPGTPKVSKTNMNKFIVSRAYELSPNIIFSFDNK